MESDVVMLSKANKYFLYLAIFTGLLVPGSFLSVDAWAKYSTKATLQKLNGSWKGRGKVAPVGGNKEAVLCKAKYSGYTKISYSIDCRGAGGKFKMYAKVRNTNGKLSGSFSESTHGISGSAHGKLKKNGFYLSVSSAKFSGNISVSLRGSSQNISIRQISNGQYINIGNISMRKR
jgi:hypothetical protein